MNITFDLKNFNTKLLFSFIIILVFFFLYLTIPNSEFENSTNSSILDRVFFTISCHTSKGNFGTLVPKSTRLKILTSFESELVFLRASRIRLMPGWAGAFMRLE